MLLQKGSSGSYVTYLQYGLKIMCCNPGSIDGQFGAGTYNAVVKYQNLKGLSADGIVGDGTWGRLKTDITQVQQALNNKGYSVGVDGVAGPGTYNAVVRFQSAHNLSADGMVGSATWAALRGSVTPTPTPVPNPGTPTNGTVSSALVEFVKSYEGFSATPYYDSVGVRTIGYGSTHGWIMNRSSVTVAEATQALMEEINSMAAQIKGNLDSKGVSLTQQQFDALCSFAYNCGTGALFSSTLYKRICAGVRDTSLKANFEAWCHGNGQVIQGLLNRRREEFDMFMYGDYTRNL
ncbi:glycoside hydrolase family protein [Clostridium saccharobutylicum]|uniref:Lysozyme n=1 Tax=Clostridium saccharobutylicum TaxID=169679 RepID=A0A1S8NI04_CLOSA|nr:peptidoglycan-binding protein [Clostridium saccharobutylicum]OOM16038.1 lysozyme RrrD [Clostridium saccharobutylicum]